MLTDREAVWPIPPWTSLEIKETRLAQDQLSIKTDIISQSRQSVTRADNTAN